MMKAIFWRYEYIFTYYAKVSQSNTVYRIELHTVNILSFHYIKYIRGANGNGGSSVITVTRIQAVGYGERIRGLSLVLSLQMGTEAHMDF